MNIDAIISAIGHHTMVDKDLARRPQAGGHTDFLIGMQ